MPDQPKTQHRSIRIPDGRWSRLNSEATTKGTNRAEVINALVAWWLREPGAKLPPRPSPADPSATASSAGP